VKLVERRVFIDAIPSSVYPLLTEADLLLEWMAPIATVDTRVGGVITWTHHNGDTVVGEFLELIENRRIVFTFGWSRADVGVPPGSTVVEIDLVPKRGGTELRLVHRGLEGPMADAHGGGWSNYLQRLARRAEGSDPGPDPLENQRVPSRRDLRLD
jgi:uncharacterized protein YndB with AHSA1/START domain